MTVPVPRRLPGHGLMLAADVIAGDHGPTVVFFPGGGQTRRSWARALREVAAMGLPALAVDLRGHGESERPADGDFSLDAMAQDSIVLTRALQRPVILVGASRGGQTAFLAAAALPEQVRACILVDIAPGANRDAVHEIRQFMLLSAKGFARAEDAAAALNAYRGTTFDGPASGLERVMRRGADGRLYWHWDERFGTDQFIDPPQDAALMTRAAQQIRCPVLLIRGELSDLVDARVVAGFHSLTPQLEVATVAGAGHMITDAQTDDFVDTILAFVRRIASPKPPES